MKLCVIGNSHVGMLAHAARDNCAEDMDLTFFARPGRGPVGTRLQGTELRAVQPQLRRALGRMGMPMAVNLCDYDGFVLVAMTASLFSLAPMVADHTVYGWPSAEEGDRPLVSEAALIAALRAEIEANLTICFLRNIRRVTTAPVLILPQPHPSEDILSRKKRFSAFRQLRHRGEGCAAANLLRQVQIQVFGQTPGVTVLEQPGETILDGFLTRAEFMRGAQRLGSATDQPETDILHANTAYGRLMLGCIRGAMYG